MSRTPVRPRRAAVVTAGVLLATFAAAPAGAARTVPLVEQPIAAPAGASSIGNGVTAWVAFRTDEATKRPVLDVWTLRGGAPVLVRTLPDTTAGLVGKNEVLRDGAFDLEVGTTKAGVPVAVLRLPGTKAEYRRGDDRTVLVRLDTGTKRRLPSKIGGLPIAGTAVDAGRLYYTVGRRKPTSRSTAALWRADVTATSTGRATKLRTSQRGSVWFSILADRGRVAIDADEPSTEAYYDNSYVFGTPSGRWNRAATISVSDGPIPVHGIAGFTKDGKALVTFLTSDDQRAPTTLTRTPIDRRGTETSVGFGTSGEDTNAAGALDPETGRILTVGTGPDGQDVFGFSGVTFAPGG